MTLYVGVDLHSNNNYIAVHAENGDLACDGSSERPCHERRKGQVDLQSDCTVGSKVCDNLHSTRSLFRRPQKRFSLEGFSTGSLGRRERLWSYLT
jgi:hypothetical protein